MKLIVIVVVTLLSTVLAEDVRLVDLDPNEASQIIQSKDQTLHYAPKIESNVPAVRFLGKEQHQVLEDIYLANQYHGQDGLGGYVYGYSVPDIAKTEKKQAGGDLRGSYNYVNGDGQEIKVEYWDDGTGFHQVDNTAQIAPQQVEDTPEVKAAREEHFRIWQEQAERNSHAPEDPNENQYDSHAANFQQQGQPQYQQGGQFPTARPAIPNYPQQPQGQSQPQLGYQGQYSTQQPQGQFSAQGQFSQPGQYSTQRPQGQFSSQQGQYSPPTPQGQSSYASQGQFGASSTARPNQIDYSGQYSEKRQIFASQPQQQQLKPQPQQQYQQQQQQQQGKNQEEEESTGPPKGFFYNIDYPVGIIVQKQGVHKREDLQNVYVKNKEEFQQQLQAHGDYRPTRAVAGAYPSYFFVAA